MKTPQKYNNEISIGNTKYALRLLSKNRHQGHNAYLMYDRQDTAFIEIHEPLGKKSHWRVTLKLAKDILAQRYIQPASKWWPFDRTRFVINERGELFLRVQSSHED